MIREHGNEERGGKIFQISGMWIHEGVPCGSRPVQFDGLGMVKTASSS